MNISQMTTLINNDPVDYKKINRAVASVFDDIHNDTQDEIQCAEKLKMVYFDLSADEKMMLNNRLKDLRYDKRQLNTMLKEYLNL